MSIRRNSIDYFFNFLFMICSFFLCDSERECFHEDTELFSFEFNNPAFVNRDNGDKFFKESDRHSELVDYVLSLEISNEKLDSKLLLIDLFEG